MKKKGLIISTVVMVVVLIASLTTATYAWFTAASSVVVDSIKLEVTSDANVNVGVKKSDASPDSKTYDDYLYNTVVVPGVTEEGVGTNGNTVMWQGDTTGLGSLLTFSNLNLITKKAVGTATGSVGSYVVDGTGATDVLGSDRTIIKAQGAGPSVTAASIEEANANVDYLDATIGMEANKPDMKGMFVKVVVKTTDKNVTLGVSASIHFVIEYTNNEGNKTSINYEPFGISTNTDLKKNLSAPLNGITNDGTQATSTFYFWVATSSKEKGFGTGGSDIQEFRIFAYIDGADVHCVKDAKGGCSIDISFDATSDLNNIKENNADVAVTTLKFLNASTGVVVSA